MKKKLLITLFLVTIIISGFIYNYTFNSKHRNIAKEVATVSLSANELYSHFKSDESLATANYLDVVLQTQGKITSVEGSEMVLSNQIQVNFLEAIPKISLGNSITIKGRCVGYDELLEVVKIDQATIINKEN